MPDQGRILVYWLGQAGFLFVFDNGQIVCIDPYLSDSVEKLAGFRRLSIAPFTSEELVFDILLLTHDHPDHLDIDAFDGITVANKNCRIIAAQSCEMFLRERQVDYNIVQPRMSFQIGQVDIRAIAADHGSLCPNAVGFLITYKTRSIYCTGDTSRNFDFIKEAIDVKPEILVPCINGAYGNLDEEGAALLAAECQSKWVIPCHFWLFAEHGGNPAKFNSYLKSLSPESKSILLTPGRAEQV